MGSEVDRAQSREPRMKKFTAEMKTRRVPHGDEHGDGEGIAHHGELHGQRGTVEAARHGGECRVKNGGVQCLHKKGGRRDGRQSNQFV